MTIDDLAVYLQLSKSSLYKLVQAGRIPAKKIGRTGGSIAGPSSSGSPGQNCPTSTKRRVDPLTNHTQP